MLPQLSCNAFGIVPRDQFYNQLQAPCLVSRTQETVINGGGGGGAINLLLVDDINTTIPVSNTIITTGTGGNRTVGDNSNNFAVQDLRSLSQFVVGNAFDSSEYQDLQTALNAAAANPPPLGTFNVVYLQPNIQYVGNITVPTFTILRGQLGAAIVGNVTIPAAATVFLLDTITQGTVVMNGQAVTLINSVVLGGANNAVTMNSGTLNAYNSDLENSSLLNPAVLINPGTSQVDINASVIQNTVPAGYNVRMQNGFLGVAYFRGNRFPGGQSRFLNNSVVIGNWFDSNIFSQVSVELDNAPGAISMRFMGNAVNCTMNITKESSPSDTSIEVLGNHIVGATISLAVNNSPVSAGTFYPHVQFRDNVCLNASIATSYTGNAQFGLILFANNYIGGTSVTHSLNTGTFQQITMIGNQIPQSSVVFTEVLAFLQNNLIENRLAAPVQINYSQLVGGNHYLVNNWLSTQGAAGIDILTGSLSNAAHNIQLMQNTFLADTAPQTLFTVALAGGSQLLSDGQNDNVNGSSTGTAPLPIPLI